MLPPPPEEPVGLLRRVMARVHAAVWGDPLRTIHVLASRDVESARRVLAIRYDP